MLTVHRASRPPASGRTLWCAASLASRAGYRVRVVVPRAAGVANEARRAARHMELDVSVAITAATIVVRLESPGAQSPGG
jgi:hypothetical protein